MNKEILIILVFIIVELLMWVNIDPLIFSLANIPVFVLGRFFYLKRLEHLEKLKRYAEQLKNIYVFSNYPYDKTVKARADEHREWLKKANNPWRVKVVEIIHGDIDTGGHPMEEFETDFQERKKQVMWDHSKERATYLREVLKIENLPHEYQKKARGLPKEEVQRIERDFYKKYVLLQEF